LFYQYTNYYPCTWANWVEQYDSFTINEQGYVYYQLNGQLYPVYKTSNNQHVHKTWLVGKSDCYIIS
jgi:hypothetical protein